MSFVQHFERLHVALTGRYCERMVRKRYSFRLVFCTGFTLPNREDVCVCHGLEGKRKCEATNRACGKPAWRGIFSTKTGQLSANRVLKELGTLHGKAAS